MHRVRLQLFFMLVALFNMLHTILFFRFVRQMLYTLAGFRIDRSSPIHHVRFFTFGKLQVGANTIINRGCYLDSRRGLRIGNNVVIAHDTKIYTLGHDINSLDFSTKGAPVCIEDYAVLFSNVMVMPGVTIGRGAVLLPGSVVTKDVAPMSIMGGNPAAVKGIRKAVHERVVKHYWFAT